MTQTFADIAITRYNILLGATILIGIIGGGAYFLLKSKKTSKISDRKPKRNNIENCNVCFAVLNLDDRKCCVPCCICSKIICRGQKCSIWLPKAASWECQLCNLSNSSITRTNEWIDRQLITNKFYHPMSKSEIFLPFPENDPRSSLKSLSISNFDSASQTPSSLSSYYGMEKDRIREHVEDILAEMLGGSLDNISVGQLSKSQKYLPLYENQNNPNEITNNNTEISHIKLKRLIERIIEETLRLPDRIDYSGIPSKDSPRKRYGDDDDDNSKYFDPKKYQELLATAVLNKIVDTYNYEKRYENNNETNETINATNLDKNHNSIETKHRRCNSSSGDSFEPRSDSSLTDPIRDVSKCDNISPGDSCSNIYTASMNENIDRESMLSDYLAGHKIPLPELSTDSESPLEDFLSCPSNGNEGTWEDNWLFKKKKLNSLNSGSSVGMLVPAPKEDIKTLIGDRTADEMSDLSDIEEDNIVHEINENGRMQNKHVIGGKSTIGIFDELLEQTSLISTSSLHENEPAYTETRNDFVLGNDGLNDIGNQPIYNFENGGIPIKNEAINSTVTGEILKNSPPKKLLLTQIENINFDEPILPPPNDFNDNQIIPSSLDGNTAQQKQLLLDNSNPDRTSSDSNATDESTHTVLDADDDITTASLNDEIKTLNQSPGHSNILNNNNQTDIITNINEINSLLINKTNNKQAKLDTLKKSPFSKTFESDEDMNEINVHLVPGSIAEREHKKWYNAVEMPNNPYAPEALRRRLSNGPGKTFDIPNINPASEETLSSLDDPNVSLEGDKTDFTRYSRDYYINENAGSPKKRMNTLNSFNIDDEDTSNTADVIKGNNEEILLSTVEQHPLNKTLSTEDNLKSINNLITDKPNIDNNNTDLYSARIIFIDETENTEKKLIDNINPSSRNNNDFYDNNNININNTNNNSDSLTPSEDSDTVRIYNLIKQETKLITKENITNNRNCNDNDDNQLVTTPSAINNISNESNIINVPTTIPKIRPNNLQFEPISLKLASTARIVTPTSFKFLQPKRKLIEPSQIMAIDSNSAYIPGTTDRQVIEDDVIKSLPSVKALAKAFLLTSKCTSVQHAKRPKSLPADFENFIKCESPTDIIAELPSEVAITTTPPSTPILENQENEIIGDRPCSPVLTPGKLKDNIAFFENLKQK